MRSIEEPLKKYQTKDLAKELKKEYIKALKNDDFKKVINTVKVKEDIAIKYTSKLEETVEELANCRECKALINCRNKVTGFVYYPSLLEDDLEFNYVACKYQKKDLKEAKEINTSFFQMPSEIKKARMADIDAKDGKRASIIKWLTKFYKDYQAGKPSKGLYLNGSFGSGKTYLISALLNELSKDHRVVIVYYPELLRSLKESFETNDFSERVNEIETAALLLLDDIGAEAVTAWNRDEILGTILQYRMDNKLPTFFTSNLTLKELETHFSLNKSAEDQVKARRITERINQLSDSLELISENRRK